VISLTREQTYLLNKILDNGIKEAVGTFDKMLESSILLEKASIATFDHEKSVELFADLSGKEFANVLIRFNGIISGSSVLSFSLENASRLVVALTDKDPGSDGFEEVMADTLYEVGNIIISGILVYIANLLATRLEHSVPEYIKGKMPGLLKQFVPEKEMVFLLKRTTFEIQTPQIDGLIFIVLEKGSLESFLAALEKHEVIESL
jgi:chemotaxis protein CheY-P-specific phosphatase CheC